MTVKTSCIYLGLLIILKEKKCFYVLLTVNPIKTKRHQGVGTSLSTS